MFPGKESLELDAKPQENNHTQFASLLVVNGPMFDSFFDAISQFNQNLFKILLSQMFD